ncbi:MAG TPA: hypothetical protein VF698_02795 [Thermoanaerobaculia bacterium]
MVCLTLIVGATTASAAPHPFYVKMLERGIASAQKNAFPEAVRELRIAAFGLMNEPAQYQLAQLHLAVVHQHLGNADLARIAATKVAAAEQLQPSYAKLNVTPAVRAAFEKYAPKVLATEQIALLMPTVDERATQVITNAASAVPPPAAAVVETVEVVNPNKAIAPATAQPAAAGAQPRAAAAPKPQFDPTRANLLDTARRLSRAGSFGESAYHYQRALPFRAGEEIHMYQEAVNRYELGELAVARTLFQRAEPGLPATAEIAAFKARLGLR